MADLPRQVVRVNLSTPVYVVAAVSLATVAACQTTPILKGLRQVLRKLGQVITRHSPAPASHDFENAGTVQFMGRTGDDFIGTPATTVEALERFSQEGRMLLSTSPGHEDNSGQGLVVSENDTEEGEEREEEEETWEWEARQWEEWEEEWKEERKKRDEREEQWEWEARGWKAWEKEWDWEARERIRRKVERAQEVRQSQEESEDERDRRLRQWEEENEDEREWQNGQQHQEERHGGSVDNTGYVGNPGDYLDESGLEELLWRMLDDGYAGNTGDYVNERGFQEVLQESFQNDHSPGGAKPAAKAAVDSLSSIPIERRHLDDGAAACTICQEIVALGECAKRMPCSHLYHHDCLLPWLKTHNACPLCRYELPTEDPEHEEQRQTEDEIPGEEYFQSPNPEAEVVDGDGRP